MGMLYSSQVVDKKKRENSMGFETPNLAETHFGSLPHICGQAGTQWSIGFGYLFIYLCEFWLFNP